jgi:hypothetical protein
MREARHHFTEEGVSLVERLVRNLPLLGFRLLSGILESGTAALRRGLFPF